MQNFSSIPPCDITPSESSKFLLSNFHILLNAQIEIGKETDKDKINKILIKYNIPTI